MKRHARIFTIGLVMGAAEVVPGVSGGTIAFITGVLERLINALRQFHPLLLVTLKGEGLGETWDRVDGNFLLTLFAGMGVAILSLASLVSYLLENEPIFVWSFFFGLVLASVYIVLKQIARPGVDTVFGIAVGTAVGVVLTNLVPVALEPTPLHLLLGGAVAICAWILPGISGSFILLILGLYRTVIEAIKELDLLLLFSLGAGCALGIVSFAQILSRLFRFYREPTLAVLTGFMLGSLVKLWPWRHTLSYQLKPDGSQIPLHQEPVLPFNYASVTGENPEYLLAVVGLILGCVGVVGLNLLSHQRRG